MTGNIDEYVAIKDVVMAYYDGMVLNSQSSLRRAFHKTYSYLPPGR